MINLDDFLSITRRSIVNANIKDKKETENKSYGEVLANEIVREVTLKNLEKIYHPSFTRRF